MPGRSSSAQTFWHPVAYSNDVRSRPLSVRLLDQRLVVYPAEGQIVVANDVCIKRGAALSGGWVADGALVCPSRAALQQRRAPLVTAMSVNPEKLLVREQRDVTLPITRGLAQADRAQDIPYVTLFEDYGRTQNRPDAAISGFGLKSGALATLTAPDDKNIVCVETNSENGTAAINHTISPNGGHVVVDGGRIVESLPLPIGGSVPSARHSAPARIAQPVQKVRCIAGP